MATKAPVKRLEPPIKVACLSCRQSRVKCDGQAVCRNCSLKDRSCVYTKSKRGGPRFSRKLYMPQGVQKEVTASKKPSRTTDDESFQAFVDSLISPGAGLARVDDDHHPTPRQDVPITPPLEDANEYAPMTRKYGSDEEILNAYYIFIHPYFPILPPPHSPLHDDSPPIEETSFQPSSPISLAISAILALIPHPLNLTPTHESSRFCRRHQAQLFSQLAIESIEIESEVLESFTNPSDALSCSHSTFERQRFHPETSVEFESILALLVLSIYEYAQRGNLAKMRNRASQALDAAMRMGLHEASSNTFRDSYQETRSRAWWMTYMCVLQSSIVGNSTPMIDVDRHAFSTPLPTINGDPRTWEALLDSQDLIMKCTRYTMTLKKELDAGREPLGLEGSFLHLNAEVESLVAKNVATYNRILFQSQVDSAEAVLITSLQLQTQIKLHSARIKLHRYQAFRDTPIFTKKHCDLKAAPLEAALLCPLSGLQVENPLVTPESSFVPSPASQISDDSYESMDPNESANICLQSALAISTAFEELPFPCPIQSDQFDLRNLHMLPRTMPAFSCCAMQGSYVLLMTCLRRWDRYNDSSSEMHPNVKVLNDGLERILGALNNYSTAFEALQGMSSQVRECYEAISI